MHKAIIIASSLTLSFLPAISNAATPFSGTYVGVGAGPVWASSSYHTNPNCPPTIFSVFCHSTGAI